MKDPRKKNSLNLTLPKYVLCVLFTLSTVHIRNNRRSMQRDIKDKQEKKNS